MITFFWLCLGIIIYTYVGYGLLVFCTVKFRRLFKKKIEETDSNLYLPTCSVVIAAFNEEYFIRKKILNTLSLNYPKASLDIYIVADGSSDATVNIIKEYPNINLLYNSERKGKIDAVNRSMGFINSEITIFTDANTLLNNDAILNICKHFQNSKVGAVAGEKRIYMNKKADASSSGEGFYWRYESLLKQWDSELNSAIGAAGELFGIRTKLYEPVPKNTILDDFIISMQIAKKGYRIVYEPNAFATEDSSLNIKEELKRKIRIATGGIQSIIRLSSLLNPFQHPILGFQFFSHRVLRWSIAPCLLIIVFFLNIYIYTQNNEILYKSLLIAQSLFYTSALVGHVLAKKELKIKTFFIPYYFMMMNYAILAGIYKYLRGPQSPIWEKVRRKEVSNH